MPRPTPIQPMTTADGRPVAEVVKGWLTSFTTSFEYHLSSFPEMLSSLGSAIATVFIQRESGGGVNFLLMLLVVVAAGVAAEWLFNRGLASRRERIRQTQPESLSDSLRILSARAGIEIGGVVVFAIVGRIVNQLLVSNSADQFLITQIVLYVIAIPRIFGALLHLVLAPRRPELRLVHVDSASALFLERQFTLIAVLVGATLFLSTVIEEYGIPHFDTVRFWMGLLFHAWLIFVTLKAKQGLTQIIEGGDEGLSPGLKRVASWWPAVSASIIGFNWLFIQFVLTSGSYELSPDRTVSAITLIVLAPFLDTIVRGIASQLVPSGDGEGEVVANAYDETRQCYLRVGRILLLGVLIMIVGKLWGLSLVNLTETGFGAQVAGNVVGFLLILAIGYFAWEMMNFSINRRLAREAPEGAGDGGGEGGTGQTRMATVLPIFRITVQVAIIVITILLALSHLGINIAPLLAGAGVLGLAIGFGAQTLVKDVVSGVFFLMDDAFRLGEFITVGTTIGQVQKISVRSLHLRQDTGPIHIIPYGSMAQLTNLSRDYVTMKLRFTVPFNTDQEKVRKLFKQIGQEMMEDPALAEVLINPFKSQGAADVTDVGIVIRGKFTTVPGGQFLVRKEVYKRVQEAFDANGIEFARKEVHVRLPESVNPGNLSEDQKKAVSAAASQAAEPDPKPAG